MKTAEPTWHKTTCILCESNCGVEVRLDAGRFTRVKGNKEHVGSKGYICEKALRLDHYQNNGARLTSPMRRRDDGTYEEVGWDTAISEIADFNPAIEEILMMLQPVSAMSGAAVRMPRKTPVWLTATV